MEIDQELRQGVIESLPEAKKIVDAGLRDLVYDAWALSLSTSGYKRIEEIRASGGPDSPPLTGGTQADHLNGVARIAVAIAKELQGTVSGFDVDMDEVIAGGLCHDLGKSFEFDPENQARWKADPATTGLPSMRHTLYGVHVALSAGLSEKIAHIAGAHSAEGENVVRSLACELVHYADYAFWRVLGKAGLLDG